MTALLLFMLSLSADSDATLLVNTYPGSLYSVLCDGSAEQVSPVEVSDASWPLVSEHGYALGRSTDGQREETVLLDIRSRQVTRVKIELPSLAHGGGDLTHDGNLAYLNAAETAIIVVNIFTGEASVVVETELAGALSPPAWSSDGSALACYIAEPNAVPDDAFRIRVCRKLGDNWDHITISPPSMLGMRSPGRARAPVWSPNGECIVFSARYQESERGHQLYAVDVDGGNLRRINDEGASCSISQGCGGMVTCHKGDSVALLNVETGEETPLQLPVEARAVKGTTNGQYWAFWMDNAIWVAAKSGPTNVHKVVN
ncbi:MAG: PD40 domain-containing protein, partial [Candidatus Hydrogenedentes bacterium]|nr:PD40 domain-containing protein [Candidatus Hydrogenedentota bacterium]